MKITFDKLIRANITIKTLIESHEGLLDTKFGYAIKRFNEKNLVPILSEYQKELEIIRIDHALEDEKTKAIIIDKDNPRGYAYSKEGLKLVNKAEEEFNNEYYKKEMEVEPVISKDAPDDLTLDQKEALQGLLID